MIFSQFLNSDLEDEEGEEVTYTPPQYACRASSSDTSQEGFGESRKPTGGTLEKTYP